MYRQILCATAAIFLVAGCTGTTPPGTDTTRPSIRLTLLSATDTPTFESAADGDVIFNTPTPCGTVRSFPARFAVAASDAGGVHTLTVRIEPSALVADSISVAPAAPASDTALTPEGDSEHLVVTLAVPGDGTTQASALLVADIDGESPVRLAISATDRAGNENLVAPVEVRTIGDEIVEIGGDQYDCRTGARFVEVAPNG